MKLSFKCEEEINVFSETQKLRESLAGLPYKIC